jgi:hypothetical protein
VFNLKKLFNRNLPVIFLVMMLSLFPSCRYLKQRLNLGKDSLKSAMEWARQDSIRVADSLKKVIAEKRAFENALTDSLLTIGEKSIPEGDLRTGYHVIIGTFINPENAKTAAEQYRSQGYETTILNTTNRQGNRAQLVSVRVFYSSDEASVFLKEFQKRVDPKAWLYAVK